MAKHYREYGYERRFGDVPIGTAFRCADGVLNVKVSEVIAECLTFDRKATVRVGFTPDEIVAVPSIRSQRRKA